MYCIIAVVTSGKVRHTADSHTQYYTQLQILNLLFTAYLWHYKLLCELQVAK